MNLWESNKRKKYIKNNTHSGLYLCFESSVNYEVKKAFCHFCKWLRKKYEFPIRVTIYVKKCQTVKLMDGTYAYGAFRWFEWKSPYIRIPTGDFFVRASEIGENEAIEEILSSLVHELTHYFQWIKQIKQTNRGSEWQANYYRYRIIDLYNQYYKIDE